MSRDSDIEAVNAALGHAMGVLNGIGYVWARIAVAAVERLAGALERPRELPEGTADPRDDPGYPHLGPQLEYLDERGDRDEPSLG